MELLLVVVISLVMTSIAIPVFTGSLEGNQLKSAARIFNRTHKYARSMAVLKGTEMFLHFNETNNVLSVSAGTNEVPLIKREIPEKIRVSDLMVDEESNDDFEPIIYAISGQCPNYSVTFSDSNDGQIEIEIDGIAGAVNISDE